MEPLSLENFDPVYAREPYLTTPRSLEACRHHGVNPEELVEIPFREFQRAYPHDPEMALRRFERVDTARKIMLESVYHKWQEICWEEENRPKMKKRQTAHETVIEVEPGKRLTVLEMQAERFRKVEKQQWKGLRNKLFTEMKKAIHDQKAKTIIEKQDNISDVAMQRRREMEMERERKLKADLAEADEKEKEQCKEIRRQQALALQEAKAKAARDKQRVRKDKRAQLRREQERLAREEYLSAQKRENFNRFRAEAIERSRQLEKQEKDLTMRMKRERAKKEELDQEKKSRNMQRLQGAKHQLERQAEVKLEKVSKSIEDFNAKVEKLKEDKNAKWKLDRERNSGKSQHHLEKVKATNKAKNESKINATLSDLERREELARQVFEDNEEQRNRRRAIKDVRQQSFELAAIRRKKALDFRKEKLEEGIKAKNDRYQAIKDGEKALKRMTESITEVISKTKMELTTQMNVLNSKDMLTTDNVVTKVHEHNDAVLFPRLKNRFSHLPLPDTDDDMAQLDREDTRDIKADTSMGTAEKGNLGHQEEVEEEDKIVESELKGLASTLPASLSASPAKSRPSTTGRLNKTMSSAGRPVALRAKAPTPAIGIKILSKSKINDTLDMMKMTLEESMAAKSSRDDPGSTPTSKTKKVTKRVKSDPLNLSGKQKPWLNGDDDHVEEVVDDDSAVVESMRFGSSAASSLDDDSGHHHHGNHQEDSSHESALPRKNTPFPGDLKPKGKSSKSSDTVDPHTNFIKEELFEDIEEVDVQGGDQDDEVDDDDIVSRIEGTPKKKKSTTRKQTISARPLTPEGKFRAEYSRDHPLAGGKGKYARESGQGKQRLVPGKRRERSGAAPERLAEVMSKQEQKKYALQRQLEDLRKHQNEALLEVLEDERVSEEQRTEMGRGVCDTKERNRLELVFAEERKRASERIIAMTKDHEYKMKQVILAMDLGS